MKTCSTCKEEKDISNYYVDARHTGGYKSQCKSCILERNRETLKRWRKKKGPEYTAWESMKDRCINKNNKGYKHYGGRGIGVCDRWIESYDNFLDDLGRKPYDSYTLERIDNDKGYSPSNCMWDTRTAQVRNQRMRKTNTSGHVGVNWDKDAGKWQARITTDKKRMSLGYFEDLEKAIKAREKAEVKYWGKTNIS